MARKKKSYNPFKMWGAYVGFGVGLLPVISISLQGTAIGNITNWLLLISWINPLLWVFPTWVGLAYAMITTPIVGFMLGWLIHSIIRKLR